MKAREFLETIEVTEMANFARPKEGSILVDWGKVCISHILQGGKK